jgi:hypothetical protein
VLIVTSRCSVPPSSSKFSHRDIPTHEFDGSSFGSCTAVLKLISSHVFGSNELRIDSFHIENVNWKVRTKFGYEYHIPKQERISISTCSRKQLISELELKGYIYNKCSQNVFYDNQCMPGHFSTLTASCIQNCQLQTVWQTSTIRWWSVSLLLTGAAYTRVFRCPHRYKSKAFKPS